MITKEIVYKIGKLQKSHGIKGEIVLLYDKPEYTDIDVDFYFMDIESIFVPFMIEEINFMTDTRGKVKFEDIDSQEEASKYSNIDIYILKSEMPEIDEDDKPFDWDWFVGYTIIDHHNKEIGKIVDIDNSTINILFVVEKDGKENLIPATEDFITSIDEETKTIYLELPEGLIE